jgi:Spy/CpxP family protein refolding chaperone
MKTFGIIAVIATALAAPFIIGCKPPRNPEHMVEQIFKDISDELNLTEAQKTLLFSIRDEFIEQGRKRHEEQERMHEDLSQLIMSDKIDTDEVKARIKGKHAEFENMIDLAVDRLAEFHDTLTPEQKERLVELMEKHRKKGMKPWHP